MRGKLKRSESLLWLFIKVCLYIILMTIFMVSLGRENHALVRLSRTMGITISTFIVVGLLFISIYGKYDVGRRKVNLLYTLWRWQFFLRMLLLMHS